MSDDEGPYRPSYYLPSLTGRHYHVFGARGDILVRPARTSTGGPAYDLLVPRAALDLEGCAARYPGVASKVEAQARDYVSTRVGPGVYRELGLERNPVLETAFVATYLP